MAENTYVNKVVFGNDTVLDLTEDSVTENTLLEGETAHSASGAPVTGTAKQGHIIWNAIKTALTQRAKLWFADAKVTDDSTEQATKVEVVQLIDDESELTNAPDGVYQGDYDDAPEDVLDASMVAYKDGSVKDALDESSKVYPTSGSGTTVTTTDVSNPFVLLNRSIVRLVVPANQLGGLGVVKRDKTDFVNVMWTDQNHTNQIVLSAILDKGLQIIKHPQSGSGVLVQYTTLE